MSNKGSHIKGIITATTLLADIKKKCWLKLDRLMLGVETRIVYYSLIYAKERRQVKMKDVYLSFRITERYNT